MSGSSGHRTSTQRERLIESHLPLVRSIARRYAGRGESVDDLVQAGSIGLIRASDRFDPRRGVSFATFAAPAIEGEIRRHLGDHTTSLRIPRELQQRARRLGRARTRLRGSIGRDPSVKELAAALGEEEGEIERALEAERACEPASKPADDLEHEQSIPSGWTEDRLMLARGARVLDERERHIVLLRFHRDLTEQQIADELGISQPHVSRLLTRALTKLREALSEDAERPSPEQTEAKQRTPPRNGKSAGSRARATPGSSGRFLVRMPGELHEELAQAAEREHVSLNRFITETLTESVSSEARPAVPEPQGPVATPDVATPDRRHRFQMLLVANLVVIVLAVVVAVALLVLALERGI